MRAVLVVVFIVGLMPRAAQADERPAACTDALRRLTDAAGYAGMFRIGDLHNNVLRACPRDGKAAEQAQSLVNSVTASLKDACRGAQAALDNSWYFDAKEGKRAANISKQDAAVAKIETSCPKQVVQQAQSRWANLFAERDARQAEAAKQAEAARQAEAAKQEAAHQAEAARNADAARRAEAARVADEKSKPTCTEVEQRLKKYLGTRGVWDAIDETGTWLRKAGESCPTEKAAELSKLVADDNSKIEKEQKRQRQAQADDEWAQDRARASAAFRRAERAEEICTNYKKVDANKALLTTQSEREVDRATGTSNVDLKRRVAAANLNIEKLIQGLKAEYVRAGGPKSDASKGKQFWCSYRSVMDVYKEEKARAVRERAAAGSQP